MLACVIFAVALAPLLLVFRSARRTGASAQRQLEAAIQGQVLLEAVLHLGEDEVPAAAGGEVDWTGAAGAGRWDEVQAFLSQATPFPLERRILAARTADGATRVTVELAWERVPGDPATRYSMKLMGARPAPPAPRAPGP